LAGQWASIADSGGDVKVSGFMVLHDDGASLKAFSAFAKGWRTVAPTGSTVAGAGAWAALIRLPDGEYRAYSARLHAVADLADGVGVPAVATFAGAPLDDVVLVQRSDGVGMPVLSAAYSAQTNTWASVTTDDPPVTSLSRFVVALWDGAAGQVHGFGARRAFWQAQAIDTCLPPLLTDGNTAAVLHEDDQGAVTVLAFSAIANAWAFSPEIADMTPFLLDHDVIGMLAGAPDACSPCAFSSYTRTWVVSPDVGIVGDFELVVRDKLVVVHRTSGLPVVQAIGALPHNAWAPVMGVAPGVLDLSEDAVIVDDAAAVPPKIQGFSGLSGGGWVVRNVTGAVIFEGTPEHGCVVSDAGGQFHAFSPAKGAWAPALVMAGATARVGDCVAIVESATGARGWSVRHNAWVAAPGAAAGSTLAYTVEGSIAARVRTPPGGSPVLDAFDERSGGWKTAALDAPVLATSVVANALMLLEGAGVEGFSAQRSDLVAAPGVTFPISPTMVGENVILFSDAADLLHAFGSTADGHLFYDWPLGTETHAFARPFAPVQLLRSAVLAEPSALGVLGIATTPFFPGVPVPGLGLLFLLPPLLATQVGVLPASPFGVAPVSMPIPAGAGAFVELWAQGAWVGASSAALVGNVPEPIRIY
jgi:hypothetical protein